MSKPKRARICHKLGELKENQDPLKPKSRILYDEPTRKTLLAMPNELKQMIYSHLPQEKALSLRKVCTQIKEGIDSLYSFTVTYDDQKGRKLLKKMKLLRIKKLIVVKFERTPPSTPPFRYPRLIKTLKMDLNKHVSPQGFHYIMVQCSGHLATLEIKICEDVLNSYSNIKFQYNYRNLINLKVSTDKTKMSLQANNDRNFVHRLLSSLLKSIESSPCELITLDVKLGLGMGNDLVSNETSLGIFNLIAKNRLSLHSLCINVEQKLRPSSNYGEQELYEFESSVLNNVDKLKELKFDVMKCQKNHISQLCKILMEKQKHLEVLIVDACSIVNQDLLNIREIIEENIFTLKSVSLFLSHEAVTCLDFSIFENGKNLKSLKLMKNHLYDLFIFDEIRHLNLLPSSLQDLKISSFSISLIEIEEFLSRKDLLYFKCLDLENCKGFGEEGHGYGVVLDKSLQVPSITKISIKGLVDPFIMQGREEIKVTKLSDQQFQIVGERKSIHHPWFWLS